MNKFFLISKFFLSIIFLVGFISPQKDDIYKYLNLEGRDIKNVDHVDLKSLTINMPYFPFVNIYYMVNHNHLIKYKPQKPIKAQSGSSITFFLERTDVKIYPKKSYEDFYEFCFLQNIPFVNQEKLLIVFKVIYKRITTFKYYVLPLKLDFCNKKELAQIILDIPFNYNLNDTQIVPYWIVGKKRFFSFSSILNEVKREVKNKQIVLHYEPGIFLQYRHELPFLLSHDSRHTNAFFSISKTYKIVTFKPLPSFNKNLAFSKNLSFEETKNYLLKKYNFFGFKGYPSIRFKWTISKQNNWSKIQLNIESYQQEKYLYNFTILQPLKEVKKESIIGGQKQDENNKTKNKKEPVTKGKRKIFLELIIVPFLLIILGLFFYQINKKK